MLILEMESIPESLSSSRTWYYFVLLFCHFVSGLEQSLLSSSLKSQRHCLDEACVTIAQLPRCGSGLGWHFPFCLLFLPSTSQAPALHSSNLGPLLIPVQYGSGPLWIKIALYGSREFASMKFGCWILFPHFWLPIIPASSADLSVQTKPLSLLCLKILG